MHVSLITCISKNSKCCFSFLYELQPPLLHMVILMMMAMMHISICTNAYEYRQYYYISLRFLSCPKQTYVYTFNIYILTTSTTILLRILLSDVLLTEWEWMMMMMLGMIMGQCEYVCGSGILYVKKHAFSPPKTGCQEDQQQECVLCVCFGVRKLGRSYVLIMWWLFSKTDHNAQ